MRDHHTGFTKIGVSFDPKAREKKLISEKPTIELLHFWEGGFFEEKQLHQKFSSLRIRGEWFNLSSANIRNIHDFLNPAGGQMHIYMMLDRNTGYTKIGLSKTPTPSYTETTLQSVVPDVEFVFSWEGDNEDLEYLREALKPKKVGGEWYDLNEGEIDFVGASMDCAMYNKSRK